ncbi:MAG TPA: hypothetical protein VF598_14365, partial [Hymenobacter sp.]
AANYNSCQCQKVPNIFSHRESEVRPWRKHKVANYPNYGNYLLLSKLKIIAKLSCRLALPSSAIELF